MYKKIFGIRREINSICPRCGIEKETLIHAMKNCPRAQAVLVYGGLNNNLLEGSYFQCVDWIEDVARMLDKKALFDLITEEAKSDLGKSCCFKPRFLHFQPFGET
ncbi:hypothetical protein Goshw_004708, partial [Gossypium schwendimanii]|nr:hypothetical protein [Gossypium schwendimanii]